jgi:hypothetical protein
MSTEKKENTATVEKEDEKVTGMFDYLDNIGKIVLSILTISAIFLVIMLFYTLFAIKSESVTGGIDTM